MTIAEPAPFTFEALDGLSFAAARARLQPLPDGAYRFDALGPVLELARLSTSRLLQAPTRANWLALDDAAGFGGALRRGRMIWSSHDRRLGFLRMRSSRPDDETEENAFKLEAQLAAVAVGFPRKLAAQLVGAFEEIQGNVYDHSNASASGLAAYRATARRFEFVVSDGGLGVLASLRSWPDYGGLADSGEALKLMLVEGVSRYGTAAKRGKGFRPLFIGLANLNGALRFRSGDQALTINGVDAGNIPAQTWEKVPSKGFITSVTCAL
jgi:anti-sigma regulatory factor (Ser/Thr protein kinase)